MFWFYGKFSYITLDFCDKELIAFPQTIDKSLK
jgi:hypothetical protein